MAATHRPTPKAAVPQQLGAALVAFVLSMSVLAYEILLTRIASVLLTNQYVFLIVGLALLGISIGAIVEYSLARRQGNAGPFRAGLWLSASAVSLVLALILIVKLGSAAGLFALAVSAALPFSFSGFVLSSLFRIYPAMSGLLYASDLLGAAIGALLVPTLLVRLGPVESILSFAAVLAGCSVFLGILPFHRVQTLIASGVVIAVMGLFYVNRDDAILGSIPIAQDPEKDLYRIATALGRRADIVDSRWSTFGRTDLVRFPDDPSTMSIFIDGAAGASMLRFNGRFDDPSAGVSQLIQGFGGMAPLLSLKEEQKNTALIIGPGGGRDVLLALQAGFRKITAVEINPEMVQIVKDYRGYNGGIYTDFRNVDVVVGEGRNFLRKSTEKYDLIMLFMPITESGRGLNNFALSESYLFTQEAFADYHDHLTNRGTLLLMGHGMPEATKVMTTALAALRAEGLTVQQAMSHLYLLGSDMMPLFGMSRTPISEELSEALHASAHKGMFRPEYSYIPGVEQQVLRTPLSASSDAGSLMMSPVFMSLAAGRLPLERVERGLGLNLSPASDDRPFFFQFSFDLPTVISTVWWLALAALVTVVFIPGYPFRKALGEDRTRHAWFAPLFFSAIGIGYMAIELALFQKLVFYLGDPSRTLALPLASLLIGSGIGSLISARSDGKAAVLGGLLAAGTVVVLLVGMAPLFSALGNSGYGVSPAAAGALLFVQGLPMGVMFPVGLRVTEARLGASAIPWMWAVSGSASVVGSASAVMIAMTMGYAWSLLFGSLCYLAAAVFIYFLLPSKSSQGGN